MIRDEPDRENRLVIVDMILKQPLIRSSRERERRDHFRRPGVAVDLAVAVRTLPRVRAVKIIPLIDFPMLTAVSALNPHEHVDHLSDHDFLKHSPLTIIHRDA